MRCGEVDDLGVAQRDPTEQPATITTSFDTASLGAPLLAGVRGGGLCLRERRGGHERSDDQSDYTRLTHAASKVLARSIALPLW